jgi:DNA-binding CsgD family transcriptional regulator
MGAMKYTAAVAHIRQLCCLGLGGQVIMPALLQALHWIIPSRSNVFTWTDESGEMTNVCFEELVTPERVALCLGALYDKDENEGRTELSEGTRPLPRGVKSEAVIAKVSYDVPLCNPITRPSERPVALRAIVRENACSLGTLMLCREPGDPPFTQREEKTLLTLTSYLARALQNNRDLRGPFADGGESGLIVLDAENRLAYGSATGRHLLLLSAHALVAPGSIIPLDDAVLTPAITQLCEDLRAAFSARDALVSSWRRQNPWGQFVFRAYPLQSEESANPLTGITIERQEPLPLRMMRTMQALPLSPKQKEICLLLSYGYSHCTISKRLNISQHTVSEHVHKIYAKLEVNTRETLLRKLH